MSKEKDIFKKGSTTYYWSSKFFSKHVRDDVFKLYSFVRVVDDIVDSEEQDVDRFNNIVRRWNTLKSEIKNGKFNAKLDDSVDEQVLSNIVQLVHRYKCDPEWVDAFLASMQMDLDDREYKTLDDTLEYIYGSAEVIGLFMVKIMRLPGQGSSHKDPEPDVFRYARLQGRAMQWINFCRDIAEDIELGRCYFPKSTLDKFNIKSLDQKSVQKNPEQFKLFIIEQLELYKEWQAEGYKGFKYIPKRQKVALKTAVDMYNWTAEEIKKDPFIVFEKKVKPTKRRVLDAAARNIVNA